MALTAGAQSSNASLNEDYYHWIDRYETKSGSLSPALFTTIKPYQRKTIVTFTDSLEKSGTFKSKADQFNQEFLQNDSWEWGHAESSENPRVVFKTSYKKKSDFLSVDKEDFTLHVNPVLYFSGGKDSRQGETLFTNTRGIEVHGTVDKRISFYTFFFDNQAVLPQYVQDQIARRPAIPHEGFWKDVDEDRDRRASR